MPDIYERALARLLVVDARANTGGERPTLTESLELIELLRALLVERQLRDAGSCNTYFPGDVADSALAAFAGDDHA